MFNIFINRSDKEDEIVREVYTISIIFARIGGFATFVFLVAGILI
jgi:hypothetical protein